ncbi:LAMI_0E04302g1_1 [Lachancea mirantina]|uniref:PRA1 family protein n=1 Tax=Lachancea mirantina TaxID=1230905 RepID=A0A1G4JKY4_9SACH|nr:LAMI_0E04302g1_1 [Lachancea mirantina]
MNQISNLSQMSRFAENLSYDRLKSEFQSVQGKLSSVRPLPEFLNMRKMSKPQNFGDAQSRMSYNLRYYSANYAVIVGALSIYTLVTNPLLLFLIVFVLASITGINRLQGQDLVLAGGRVFKPSQLYTALFCVGVPLFILASPISTMTWLIGASAVSVLGHASLMEKPIETVFEEETV